jgi:Fic family protein
MHPFIPEQLPIQEIDWQSHITLVGKANAALAKFEGVLYGISNPEIFIAPLRTKEAVLSSKMEGTQTSFEEVLLFDAGELDNVAEKKDDYVEVLNYRKALIHAESGLVEKPFHLNMLLNLHEILLDSVRGRDKARGRLRTTQNWIGPEGRPIEDAVFVPPVPETVLEHISAWEKYYHMDEKDALIQLAIIHAQFEIIHPFLDGNGRLGRILVPLFLFEKKLLSRPVFYLSAYLEEHKDEYTARLRDLGRPGAWDRWISFFLTAIVTQADINREIARNILNLYTTLKEKIMGTTRSVHAISTLDFVFEKPYFFQSSLSKYHEGLTQATVGNLVRLFVELGILVVVRPGKGRRSTMLYAPELFDVCDGTSPKAASVASS